MLWLKSSFLFIAGISNIIVALAVLMRGARKINNISFFALSVAMAGWTIGIGVFLLVNQQETAFLWAKIYYLCPLVVTLALPFFVQSFPDRTKFSLKWVIPLLFGFFILAVPLLSIHNFVTEGVVYHSWGKEIVLNGTHYLIYSAYLLICFPLCLWRMYRISRQEKGIYGTQAEIFFFGFLVAAVFGVFFNLILPWAGNYRLIWVGPIFTSSFIIAIAYSIVRHRMFNVHLIVARSIAYIASLAVIASIYGFIVFGICQHVFKLELSVSLQVFLSAATGVAALGFPTVKGRFDQLTNRFFYRDAYDPQAFFDEFNRALVSTTDLEVLLDRTTNTIAAHLKAQYCLVSVKDGSEHGQRIVGTTQKGFLQSEISRVRRITPQMRRAVIVTEDIQREYRQLYEVLTKSDIAILVRLAADYNDDEELGYIALGSKKSGNPYNGQDVQVLEAAANELIIAIQNAMRFEEIEKFTNTLQDKIEEATRKLRQTNEKLRKLDETKDDFISMASHQLRTPLTSVKGYVSMVLDGDAGKITALQRKLLTQSFISSQRMVYLISDLLNVSRLKTGKFIIEAVPTNLADVIEEEIDQLQETAKGRNLELIYKKPEHFPTLMLDETKIRQVLMNFIDNAVYYTPSGGHITINLVDRGRTIEYTVVDDGIGVPKYEQHHLFSKFFRAHNAKRARPDGTGLGLFMAKKVIIAQGGAIVFKSQEGRGSTFGFTFAKERLLPKNDKPSSPTKPAPIEVKTVK